MRSDQLVWRQCFCGVWYRAREDRPVQWKPSCRACQLTASINRHTSTIGRLSKQRAEIREQQKRAAERRGPDWAPPPPKEVTRHAGAYVGSTRVRVCDGKVIERASLYDNVPDVTCKRCEKKLAQLGPEFAERAWYSREMEGI